MNRCIISISSNHLPEKHMNEAFSMLRSSFQYLKTSKQLETEPMGKGYSASFVNCVGVFSAENNLDEVKEMLKSFESKLGRTDELRAKKIVPIDLDIIIWNNEVIHEDYYRFPFIEQLIRSLNP